MSADAVCTRGAERALRKGDVRGDLASICRSRARSASSAASSADSCSAAASASAASCAASRLRSSAERFWIDASHPSLNADGGGEAGNCGWRPAPWDQVESRRRSCAACR